MRNLSLKWIIFSFYMLLGFMPLLAVSYLTIAANTQSLEASTHQSMSILLSTVADQVEKQFHRMNNDLQTFSRSPEIVSFLNTPHVPHTTPFPLKTHRSFLDIGTEYRRILLYSTDGEMLAAAGVGTSNAAGSFVQEKLSDQPRTEMVLISGNPPEETAMLAAVWETDDTSRILGYVYLTASLESFTRPFRRISLGEEIEKRIVDSDGRTLWVQAPESAVVPTVLQKPREYYADVPMPGWRLWVQFPENAIFGEIHRQLLENLIFTGVVALIAAAACFEFSRRISNHIQKISNGSHRFASGDLDHRIAVSFSQETNALADELNSMAARLKEHQSELIRNNRLACMGLFSAEIAHELKNPLSGIKTSAQALERLLAEETPLGRCIRMRGADAEDVRVLTGGINEEVERLSRILSGLLDFARPSPSRMVESNLDALVNRSVRAVRGEIRRLSVRLVSHVEPFRIAVDPDQLVQILINLLLNAMKAVVPGEGVIRIECERTKDGETVLSVTDNGIGIPEKNLDRIFDPFFTSSQEGCGLGLSVVHTLASMNNIQIRVYSCEEQGTRVCLVFKNEILEVEGNHHG